MLYVYACIGTYLVLSLPLAFLLYTTIVAAKWGDNEIDIEIDMDNEFQWIPQ